MTQEIQVREDNYREVAKWIEKELAGSRVIVDAPQAGAAGQITFRPAFTGDFNAEPVTVAIPGVLVVTPTTGANGKPANAFAAYSIEDQAGA